MADNDNFGFTGNYQDLLNQLSAFKQTLMQQYQGQLYQSPQIADVINQQIKSWQSAIEEAQLNKTDIPADSGLLNLIGLGDKGIDKLDESRRPPPLPDYDEEVTSERLQGIADLYYIYQQERNGVFRAVLKLQDLFKAGKVRLASGPGAIGLYQFDRQRVLRYTRQERMQAYRRVFGYTSVEPISGSKPNNAFHNLFMHFTTQVAQYFRDQRVSELMQSAGHVGHIGSVAVVRRAGLDLRNNLKGASYGHVNVLRVEVLQLLEQAFDILGSEDVRRLFGAENAWDSLEDILERYLGEQTMVSQRSRMAVAGRDILAWLAQPYILTDERDIFDALLKDIRDATEEWLTSAESVGMSSSIQTQTYSSNVVPFSPKSNIA